MDISWPYGSTHSWTRMGYPKSGVHVNSSGIIALILGFTAVLNLELIVKFMMLMHPMLLTTGSFMCPIWHRYMLSTMIPISFTMITPLNVMTLHTSWGHILQIVWFLWPWSWGYFPPTAGHPKHSNAGTTWHFIQLLLSRSYQLTNQPSPLSALSHGPPLSTIHHETKQSKGQHWLPCGWPQAVPWSRCYGHF